MIELNWTRIVIAITMIFSGIMFILPLLSFLSSQLDSLIKRRRNKKEEQIHESVEHLELEHKKDEFIIIQLHKTIELKDSQLAAAEITIKSLTDGNSLSHITVMKLYKNIRDMYKAAGALENELVKEEPSIEKITKKHEELRKAIDKITEDLP